MQGSRWVISESCASNTGFTNKNYQLCMRSRALQPRPDAAAAPSQSPQQAQTAAAAAARAACTAAAAVSLLLGGLPSPAAASLASEAYERELGLKEQESKLEYMLEQAANAKKATIAGQCVQS